MLETLLYLVLPAGVVASCIYYRDKVVNFLKQAKYELVYWALGTLAVGDDILWGWKNKLKELPKKSGEIAIVTGGSRGLGFEVVRELLKCDMTVVIACRNVNAGQKAIEKLRQSGVSSGVADVLPLDTASQSSVKTFAQLFKDKYQKLHLLINNGEFGSFYHLPGSSLVESCFKVMGCWTGLYDYSLKAGSESQTGIMFVPYKLTEDGFESQLAVNYLGHFTLTNLLMDRLIEGGEPGRHSRVVNVSSCAHIPGAINYKDFHYKKDLYIPSQAYAQSKLAQIMFTKAAERRARTKNRNVSFFALHPGVVNTELFDGTVLKTLFPWAPGLFFKRPEQGAVTILYTALSAELENQGGAYLANCRKSFTSSLAKNEREQEKLMAFTQDMLGIPYFGDVPNEK